jgi:hypothetical protein
MHYTRSIHSGARYSIFVKPPDTLKMRWDNFLIPFSLRLWIALVGTLLIIAVHFTLIYYLGRRFGNEEEDSIKFYTFLDSILNTFTNPGL